MTFASTVAGRQHKRAKALMIQALRKEFDPAKGRDQLKRLYSQNIIDTVELAGIGSHAQVRVLALVDSTPFRTYAVTVITPGTPSKKRLLEVAEILGSTQLSKPRSLT